MKFPLLTAAALALTACAPGVGLNLPGGAPGAIPPAGNVATGPALVSPTRAIGLFDNVCGASLPKFANVAAAASANGVTSQSGGGVAISPTEDVSFQVVNGPGNGTSCVMTFNTTATTLEVSNALTAAYGAVQQTPFGPAAKYRSRNTLVLIDPNVTDRGSSRIFRLSLLSER
ncbi:hypothetical protein ACEYYB_13595 [Paracoccus sp. p4-l81]|uniref:hypothetical protein n=1 Tax=unclassified Paracoccus (in: a-proteobacteria) TaxID=2688777 RepID=UPI0035B8C32C